LPFFSHASVSKELDVFLKKKLTLEPCESGFFSDPEVYAETIRSFLKAGVARLETVNAPLIEDRLKNAKRGIKITCRGPIDGGEADTTPGILWKKTVIRVGKTLQNPAGLNVPGVIFHEFLHAIAFDNLKTSWHNDLTKLSLRDEEGYTVRERDLVYTCAVVAFPAAARDFNEMSLARATETCANGRVVEGRVVRYSPKTLY
ncbi:MAG: hypothetical protein V4760_03695, partial [Bdellovibrionota bacterium]